MAPGREADGRRSFARTPAMIDHFSERIGVPTLFFPMTRIERMTIDEPSGSIPSMDELFSRKVGRRLIDYLAQFA